MCFFGVGANRRQANLEKQNKELGLRVVDLGAQSYHSPQSTTNVRQDSRIEELTSQLNNRSGGGAARVAAGHESSRGHRMEEYEAHIQTLRQQMVAMQTEESNLTQAKRKVELDACDCKQKALK